MVNIHMPSGWSSFGQLHAVWPWACHVVSQAVVSAVANGVHYLLPQAVLSGNLPLSLFWGSGDLVLPEDPAVILCRLSCPDVNMSLGAWFSALHSLATHCGSKYKDGVSFFRCPGDRFQETPRINYLTQGPLAVTSRNYWRPVYLGDLLGELKPGHCL